MLRGDENGRMADVRTNIESGRIIRPAIPARSHEPCCGTGGAMLVKLPLSLQSWYWLKEHCIVP
jgi:hypothetical protein